MPPPCCLALGDAERYAYPGILYLNYAQGLVSARSPDSIGTTHSLSLRSDFVATPTCRR
jgi:hypothetical protein